MKNHYFLKFIFTSFLLIFLSSFSIAKENYKTKNIILNNNPINVEIADTEKKLILGLMHRKHLDKNKGMLFVFNHSTNTSFWMYNMEIPLDILFLKNNKIVKIYKNVPFCRYKTPENCPTYPSKTKVDMALELSAGYCQKHNIKKGQKINF